MDFLEKMFKNRLYFYSILKFILICCFCIKNVILNKTFLYIFILNLIENEIFEITVQILKLF